MENLQWFFTKSTSFSDRSIAADETCVHYYTLLLKCASLPETISWQRHFHFILRQKWLHLSQIHAKRNNHQCRLIFGHTDEVATNCEKEKMSYAPFMTMQGHMLSMQLINPCSSHYILNKSRIRYTVLTCHL